MWTTAHRGRPIESHLTYRCRVGFNIVTTTPAQSALLVSFVPPYSPRVDATMPPPSRKVALCAVHFDEGVGCPASQTGCRRQVLNREQLHDLSSDATSHRTMGY